MREEFRRMVDAKALVNVVNDGWIIDIGTHHHPPVALKRILDDELVLEDDEVGVAQGREVVKSEFCIHEAIEDGVESGHVFRMAAQFFLVQTDADAQAFIVGRHVEVRPKAIVIEIKEFSIND